ncbi:MAG: lysophospholipid acyltransferase family protein [Spirochaetales bacterium]|nr:lysophospholipid acyltransferase family protein [Spirochaetales bacterium]
MIKARHTQWAQIIFDNYINKLLKKNFSHFYLTKNLAHFQENTSYLITPNHISWWDGFFVYPLFKKWLHKKAHLVMLESQLTQYWYFRHIGAFSINPGDRNSVKESLNYSLEILAKKDNFLVLYPQGKIESLLNDSFELHNGGLRYISRNIDCHVFIVGFCINYHNEMKPEIIMHPGPILTTSQIRENHSLYQEAFHDTINQLKAKVAKREFITDIFPNLKKPKPS